MTLKTLNRQKLGNFYKGAPAKEYLLSRPSLMCEYPGKL